MHGSNKNWTMKPLSRHKCVHRSQFPYLQGVDLCQHEVVGKQGGLDAVAERQPVIAVQGNRDGSQSSRILPTFTNPTPYSLSLARLMNSVPSPSANPLPIDIAVAQRGQRVTASHPRAPSVSPKLFTPQHRQRRRYQPTATMHNRHVLPDGDDDDGSLHRRRRKDVVLQQHTRRLQPATQAANGREVAVAATRRHGREEHVADGDGRVASGGRVDVAGDGQLERCRHRWPKQRRARDADAGQAQRASDKRRCLCR